MKLVKFEATFQSIKQELYVNPQTITVMRTVNHFDTEIRFAAGTLNSGTVIVVHEKITEVIKKLL